MNIELKELFALVKSEDTSVLDAALAEAQSEMAPVEKNQENPYFQSTYSNLMAIREISRLPLSKRNILFTQYRVLDWMITEVSKDNQWRRSFWPIKADKPGPQPDGSASSYAKRYGGKAILGIVDANEDDDAERATKRGEWQGRTGSNFEKNAPLSAPRPSAEDDYSEIINEAPISFGKYKGMKVSQIDTVDLESYKIYIEHRDKPSGPMARLLPRIKDELKKRENIKPASKHEHEPEPRPTQIDIKRMFQIADQQGWTPMDVQDYMHKEFNKTATADLSVIELNMLISNIMEQPRKGG
jgi:hypothetical protein